MDHLPEGAWWCPACGVRSDTAPKGAARSRPPELLPSGAVANAAPVDTSVELSPPSPNVFALDPGWRDGYLDLLRVQRRRRLRYSSIAGLALVGAVLLSMVLLTTGSATTLAVPLGVGASGGNPVFNAPVVVQVAIGNNKAVPVTLDTGSVGLRVFANALSTADQSGVEMSRRSDSVQFDDGSMWAGSVATAKVHIDGVTTAAAIPIQIVRSISCVPRQSQCPANGGINAEEREDSDGILGVGLSGPLAGDPVTNPLLSLPGPLGRSWSVSLSSPGPNGTGQLLLGAPGATSPVTEIHLALLGTAGGRPVWDDMPNLCWGIGMTHLCAPTIFDSGSELMHVASNLVDSMRASFGVLSVDTLAGSVPVEVAVPGHAPFWSFDSGDEPGVNAVAVQSGQLTTVNTGIQAFASLIIRYDPIAGTIEISHPSG